MQTRIGELTRWHERKTQDQEARHSGKYISWIKNNIKSMLGNILKKYASWYYQLKVDQGAIGTFLAKI